jgi:hypothetical protein
MPTLARTAFLHNRTRTDAAEDAGRKGMTAADPRRTRSSPHVQPLPEQPGRIRQSRPWLKRWVVLFCALTLGLGSMASWLFAPDAQDRLTPAEIEQRAATFAKMPPLQLKTVPATELDTRLADMKLTPVAQVELKQLLQQAPPRPRVSRPLPAGANSPNVARAEPSSVRLIELTLWDSHAADGDVVRVISAGYSRDVVLYKQPLVLAVPVQAGVPIQILGVHDGGGGITLAVKGADSPVMTPIMSEGQTISLPIAP